MLIFYKTETKSKKVENTTVCILYFFLKKIILLFHYNPVVLRFGFDFGMFGGIHHLN